MSRRNIKLYLSDIMVGMRNIVIHEYFEVDFDTLWKTAVQAIPRIKPSIEVILAQTGS